MSTNAVSRPTTAATTFDEELITRYTLTERVNHWIGALTYIYLLATGLAFWTPYLFWLAMVVGGGATARFMHPWIGLLFTLSLSITFVQWRRDMVIDDDDRKWADDIQDYITG
jgi:formate dehydrogenase subunit gamma